jgi:membrane-associated phospholipid phosphatase
LRCLMQNSYSEIGLQWVLFFQSLGDWLILPMQFFSFLGQEEFFLLVMPALIWCVNMALGLRVGFILLLADSLRILLKLAFHTPRPFWVSSQVRALTFESSFGLPSGHANNAAAVWGLLAAHQRHPAALVGIGALIFLIGLSRVFLGVHFPCDVLAGWILGFVVLWAFLRLERPVLAWLSRRNLGMQVLAAFVLTIAFVLTGALIRSGLGDWQMPQEWIQNASAASEEFLETGPLSLSELLSSSGALFGLAAGAIWLVSRGGFDSGGIWHRRLLRYPAGLLGVIVLWYGLGAVLPRGETWLPYALRYLRYFLIGFWISGLAPMLFIQMGLARPAGATLPSKQPVPSAGR